MDSIRDGYARVRANLGNVAVLYILAIGIGIGFGIVMIPITLLLIVIPVGAGFAVYALAQSVTGAIIAGVVLGIPMLVILIFISGLYQTFESTYWTLGYRAVKVVGLIVLWLITSLPILGALIWLFIAALAVGAVVLTRFGTRAYPPIAPASVAPTPPLAPSAPTPADDTGANI